jgi:RNA polymerase sigma-70 factor, ECF subfamily
MDREAEFGRLYAAHRTAVHAYFAGRTGDRWVAADLMQEVFMRVWQRLPELEGKSSDGQRAWIFTVARNLSIDAHRREGTRAGAEEALRRQPPPGPPSTTTAVIAAERVTVLRAAIDRLPEQQRTTLALAAAGGLTSTEIATALHVPAGTVRYWLALARRALATALDSYDNPPAATGEQ